MTSANLAYNLAVGLCGGFSPFVATLLVDKYGNAAPGYIVSVLAVVSWIGLYVGSTGKKWNQDVDADGGPKRLSNVV